MRRPPTPLLLPLMHLLSLPCSCNATRKLPTSTYDHARLDCAVIKAAEATEADVLTAQRKKYLTAQNEPSTLI